MTGTAKQARAPAASTDLYVANDYQFAAVEGLSRKALDLHMDLYRGYVKQVNALYHAQMDQLAARPPFSEAQQLHTDGVVRRLAFEFNGMVLHELFFEQLDGQPAAANPAPGSALKEAIDVSFGGFENWQNDIRRLAETRGIGWVVSARQGSGNRLTNYWVSEHHLGVLASLRPIAVFDIWEHAYFLDFAPTARKDYIGVLFRNLDWSVLERRCLP